MGSAAVAKRYHKPIVNSPSSLATGLPKSAVQPAAAGANGSSAVLPSVAR